MGFLEFLEQTAPATFIRESSSLLAFPAFLCLHTLGLSFLVGANSIVAVRVLGLASTIPLQPLRRLFPFMWLGLILTVVSGLGLAMAKATTIMLNPILLFKLALIAVAVVLMAVMEKKVFPNPPGSRKVEPGEGRMMAAALLVLWTAVMTAGRLIAYSSTIFGR